MHCMRTTVELPDALLARAKRVAKRTGRPVRALIEEGLRLVVEADQPRGRYQLPDLSVGKPGAKCPVDSMDWSELRGEIYGGR